MTVVTPTYSGDPNFGPFGLQKPQRRPSRPPSTPDKPAAKLNPLKLGAKFTGSASTGHVITMPEGAPSPRIFGTDEPYQINELLSHRTKVLHGSEAGDAADA